MPCEVHPKRVDGKEGNIDLSEHGSAIWSVERSPASVESRIPLSPLDCSEEVEPWPVGKSQLSCMRIEDAFDDARGLPSRMETGVREER